MWRDVFLAVIAAVLIPTLILVYRIFRAVVIYREFPPHLHVDKETIRYPTGMEPGKVERLDDRRSASASP